MIMKYSKFKDHQFIKKRFPDYDVSVSLLDLVQVIQDSAHRAGSTMNIPQCLQVAQVLKYANDRRIHNVYIEDGDLVQFLESTEFSDKDSDKIKILISEFMSDYPYRIIIHKPNQKHSVFCGVNESTDDERIALAVISDMCMSSRVLSEVGFFKNPNGNKEMMLVINLILYLSTFPDQIHKGLPDNMDIINAGNKYQKRNPLRISTAEPIKEAARMGVSPHMRRGHFRFLKSDKYTKKQFQTVYVKPTFVKGSASTVNM